MSSTPNMNKNKNRLANERSPYLLQHATNPVDWYPWGEEAFKKAKELNRPIFLSVGYSTCHWCHVMELESFEDEHIGKLLNENFISIKVDREERPDVDKLYMSFIQSLTGGGGWPMNVFLTPNLEPITGGTYFPPSDAYGRMSFTTVLELIAQKWQTDQAKLQEQGRALADAIREGMHQKKGDKIPNADEIVQNCYSKLSRQFDATNGGFGAQPKFPKPVDLDLLLYYYFVNRNARPDEATNALKMVEITLEKMFHGGIHDHVGKGFHRYSVDQVWHVPHFEKMLYDQGQLLKTYANFSKITGGKLAPAVEDIADYIIGCLSHPLGGFFSAEDADSYPTHDAKKKKEGAFCVWTKAEVEEVLGNRPSRHNENVTLDELVSAAYKVEENGNVPPSQDPHDELVNQNILHMVDPPELEKIANDNKMNLQQLEECLADARGYLAQRRTQRPKPHLDNKILTAWNALAISGLCAAAGAVPARTDLKQRAELTVKFIREHLVLNGELLRSAYVDEGNELAKIDSPIMAFSDDYAFLIEALLDLYELNFDEGLLQWACELQQKMDELFWEKDPNNSPGYYLSRSDDPSIFARIQEEQDGAEPSTNSVATSNLLRMSLLFDNKNYREKAEGIFTGVAERLNKYPYILPKLCIALHSHKHTPIEIIVVGRISDGLTVDMIRTSVHTKYVPQKMFVFIDKDKQESWITKQNDILQQYASGTNKPTVYLCRNFACELPVHTMEDLRKKLDEI